MAREAGQDRGHSQLPLPGDDLPLQGLLAFQPGDGQRSLEAVQIRHPVPGKVRRRAEIGADLLVRHPEFLPDLVPDSLLAGDGERQGYAVHRHPVNEALPLLPSPPGHRVAVGAVVQEEAVLDTGIAADGRLHARQPPGQLDGLVLEPGDVDVRHVLEVPVQAHRLGIDVVAGDTDLASGLFHLEEVLVGRGLDEFETGSFPAQDPMGEVVGGGSLQQRASEKQGEEE